MSEAFEFNSIEDGSPLNRIQSISVSASGQDDDGGVDDVNIEFKKDVMPLSPEDTRAIRDIVVSWFEEGTSLTYDGTGE